MAIPHLAGWQLEVVDIRDDVVLEEFDRVVGSEGEQGLAETEQRDVKAVA